MPLVTHHKQGRLIPFMAYSRRDLPWLIGLVLTYALSYRISLIFSHSGITLIYLPGGLALAALLIGGYKYWPAIFGGACLAGILNGNTLLLSVGMAMGNTLEPMLGAWLLTRASFDPGLRRNRDFMQLLLKAGIVSACIGSLMVAAAQFTAGELPLQQLPYSLSSWWMSHMLAITLITPMLLTWRHLHMTWLKPERRTEFTALFALAFLSGQVIFLAWLQDGIGQYFEEYLLFIFAAWAGLRFGRHGVSLVLLLFLCQALTGVSLGTGFLGSALTVNSAAYNVWSYFAELVILGMVLATTIREKNDTSTALRVSEERFHTMFQHNSSAMLLIDPFSGRIVDANRAAINFYGYPEASFRTMTFNQIGTCPIQKMMAVMTNGQSTGHIVCSHRLANDELRTVDVYSSPVEVDNQSLLFSIVIDITEKKRLEQELEQRANTDSLTGLSNRRHFLEQAELELARTLRYGGPLSILLLDADYFKNINDSYGHKAGDVTLKRLADLCRETLREVDIIGRIGGEEFAILLPETDGVQALDVAERLRLAMAYTDVLLEEGGSLRFTVSIGIATLNSTVSTVQCLLKQADHALYEAKRAGRNRVCASSQRSQQATQHTIQSDATHPTDNSLPKEFPLN